MMINCQSSRRSTNVKRLGIPFTKTISESAKSGVFTWTKALKKVTQQGNIRLFCKHHFIPERCLDVVFRIFIPLR